MFAACLALSFVFSGPPRLTRLVISVFILVHKSVYIFARSIVFLHGASFSMFLGFAASTPLFVLFLVVLRLLCKPVNLDLTALTSFGFAFPDVVTSSYGFCISYHHIIDYTTLSDTQLPVNAKARPAPSLL